MTNAADMTPEQKLQFLEDQVVQVRTGALDWMLCPYCGAENTQDRSGKNKEKLVCCKPFETAVLAIIDRADKQAAMDFMENVADRTALNVSKYMN